MLKQLLEKIFSKSNPLSMWEYGTCNGKVARRHKVKKNVQFVLWEAGEYDLKEDYWHDFNSSWWNDFIPEPKSKNVNNKP